MKYIHLSDLHIGKRVNEYSMLEDQEYILTRIINIIDEERPDGVFIAGDVYDKSIPSGEAVQLFDSFLTRLAKRNLSVFVISGNHDSPERIAFGGKLMNRSGIYMSPVYDGKIEPVTMEDEYGKVNIYMLPFIKPAHVRAVFKDDPDEIQSYTDAVRKAIDELHVDTSERNIMITHQFVTGADRTESEEISVGGTDNVDVSVFECFDYTALGHIHRPQNCKSDKVRYCGTPLKYSFSEAKDEKSVTVIELTDTITVRTVPLAPLRDMKEIKGLYNDIMAKDFYKDTTYETDYIHITLTDEEDIPDAIGRLRTVYHNLMKLDYDNKRTRANTVIDSAEIVKEKLPNEYFAEFYDIQNGQPMSETQQKFIDELIEQIQEEYK
ncbi:MAG: exonuclease SbcCD subunit D [Oscillospiraceae bacterium]|nr:exonuclease SbcCD subunit D [Oscillospiraceae bacterium]